MTSGLELELFPLVHITLSNCFFISIIHQMKVVPLSLNWVREKIFIKLQHSKQVQQIVLIDQQLWHHLDRSRVGELLGASSETLEQKAPDTAHLQRRAVSSAAVFSQSWHVEQIGNEGPFHFCRDWAKNTYSAAPKGPHLVRHFTIITSKTI